MKASDLNIIKNYANSDDIIYEVFQSKKKSFIFHIWDMIFEDLLSSASAIHNHAMLYLIASETEGKLIEVKNGTVIKSVSIPDWTSDQKYHFKKVVLDRYVYKKYRQV